MTMSPNRCITLALTALLCLCHSTTLAAPKPRLDVRTMSDWSIVVAESATEAEAYAAEEFRDFFAQATGYELPSGPPRRPTRITYSSERANR